MATIQTSLIVLTVVVVLSVTTALAGKDCQKTQLRYKLSKPGCKPVTIQSWGCMGFCNSYSRISPDNHLEVQQSCTCCQESGHFERTQRLICPNRVPGYREVSFRVPKRCLCRPCRSLASVSSIQTLDMIQQGLQG